MNYFDTREWRAKQEAREAEERETQLHWLSQQEPRQDLLAMAARMLAENSPDELHRWFPGILSRAFKMRAPGKPSYSKPIDYGPANSGWRAVRIHGYRVGHIWHRGERDWIGVHEDSKNLNAYSDDVVATGTNRNAAAVALGEYDRVVFIARAVWVRDRLADQRPEVLEAEAALDKLSPPEARRLIDAYLRKLDRR